MVNAGGCNARACIDVYDPIRVRKLKEWAESDARFLRKLSMMKEDEDKSEKLSASLILTSNSQPSHQSPEERFACRQRYLRSYRFTRNHKDKIIEKTKKWLKSKKKENEKTTEKNDKGKYGSCHSLLKGSVKLMFSCIASDRPK